MLTVTDVPVDDSCCIVAFVRSGGLTGPRDDVVVASVVATAVVVVFMGTNVGIVFARPENVSVSVALDVDVPIEIGGLNVDRVVGVADRVVDVAGCGVVVISSNRVIFMSVPSKKHAVSHVQLTVRGGIVEQSCCKTSSETKPRNLQTYQAIGLIGRGLQSTEACV
jgi:hypothetical protein